MSLARSIGRNLAVGLLGGGGLLVGCSSDGEGDGAGDSSTIAQPQARHCGDPSTGFYGGICEEDEFCVETRGAACQGLPPPGEQCPAGCTLTEHCCNCPAFGCLRAPVDECEGAPSCGCVSKMESFVANCPDDRRECTEGPNGAAIVCIAVAFDEDPFRDAGPPGVGIE